ncbi:MAG: RsmE family RNA methyltransferase [Candidatus Krumholzibacteriia bacterium]
MRLFYLPDDADPRAGDEVCLEAEESRHLCTVLRAQAGDVLELTDGRGHLFTARLLDGRGRQARVRVEDRREAREETRPPRLRLACAVVKGRRFESALEKAVELGVHEVVPLLTRRGEVRPGDGKQERWRGIVRAAVKQARRALAPELAAPAPLSGVLTGDRGSVFWGAVPGDLPAAAAATVVSWSELPGRVEASVAPDWLTFVVGPEGGFTGAERELLVTRGAVPVSLGPHVLRTETAALAGLLALQALRVAWHRRVR